MNHNKHNLQVGDKVILDETYVTSSHVYIDSFTPMSMYATVHAAESDPDDPESYWQVMTARLTPIFVQADPGEDQPNGGVSEGTTEGVIEGTNIPLPTGILYYIEPKYPERNVDEGKVFHSENYKPIN